MSFWEVISGILFPFLMAIYFIEMAIWELRN